VVAGAFQGEVDDLSWKRLQVPESEALRVFDKTVDAESPIDGRERWLDLDG
jgi:hypothetical protein